MPRGRSHRHVGQADQLAREQHETRRSRWRELEPRSRNPCRARAKLSVRPQLAASLPRSPVDAVPVCRGTRSEPSTFRENDSRARCLSADATHASAEM